MNKISLIWDLDGTLIDSYETIVSSLYDTLLEYKLYIDKENILKHVKKESLGSFINAISNEYNLSADYIDKRAHELIFERQYSIKPIQYACELLKQITNQNISNYLYTHKNKSTYSILDNLDMSKYFSEIVTIENGFKRKPSPDAVNYLVQKYNLDKKTTYYIGDRKLDIECAYNAGIKSILYLPKESYVTPTGKEDYIIEDLLEILDIIS